MVLPPYFFKPASTDGLLAFFAPVVQATRHPVVLYHIPRFSVPIPPEVAGALDVWGVKDSGEEADYTPAIVAAGREVLVGTEDDLAVRLGRGGSGVVSGLGERRAGARREHLGRGAGGRHRSRRRAFRAVAGDPRRGAGLRGAASGSPRCARASIYGTVRPPLDPDRRRLRVCAIGRSDRRRCGHECANGDAGAGPAGAGAGRRAVPAARRQGPRRRLHPVAGRRGPRAEPHAAAERRPAVRVVRGVGGGSTATSASACRGCPHGAAAWEAPRFVTDVAGSLRAEPEPVPDAERRAVAALHVAGDARDDARGSGTRAASRASSPCSGRRRSAAASRSTRAARGARRRSSSTRRARSAATRRRCSRTAAGCSPCTTRSRPAAGTATTTASCASRTTARRGRSIRCPAPRAVCTRRWCRLDGGFALFFRSRAADRIYVSRSTDGVTWSEPSARVLPNNNASIQAATLPSGAIAIVFNHFSANDDPDTPTWPKRRYPLTIALSEDGGRTWPYMRHVDPGDGFFGAANERAQPRLRVPDGRRRRGRRDPRRLLLSRPPVHQVRAGDRGLDSLRGRLGLPRARQPRPPVLLMRIAVIADDLTGAADTGVQLARAGHRTAVVFHGEPRRRRRRGRRSTPTRAGSPAPRRPRACAARARSRARRS